MLLKATGLSFGPWKSFQKDNPSQDNSDSLVWLMRLDPKACQGTLLNVVHLEFIIYNF